MHQLLSTKQAAELLGVSPRTLERWRCYRSDGPPYRALGTRCLYHPADLEAWLESRRRRHTSDPGPAAQ